MAAPTSKLQKPKQPLANGEPSIHGPKAARQLCASYRTLKQLYQFPKADIATSAAQWVGNRRAYVPIGAQGLQ
jgi:hypothetical protein